MGGWGGVYKCQVGKNNTHIHAVKIYSLLGTGALTFVDSDAITTHTHTHTLAHTSLISRHLSQLSFFFRLFIQTSGMTLAN